MSLIQTPWIIQPQQAVGIDWGNPINRGLAQVWIQSCAISPSGVAAANYGSRAYGKYGVAGKGNGSSTFALLNGSTRAGDAYGSSATTDGAVTFLAAVKLGALASQQHFMNTCDGSGNAMGFRTNTTSIGLSQASGGSILNFTSAVTAGESCIVCVSGRNGSTDFFKNGRFVSNSAVSYVNTIADGVPVIGRSGTSAQYGDHEIYLLLAFNRRLSKSEGEILTANPWQIFKPIPRRIFAPLATGSGTTAVTADHNASYTITGSVAADASAAYAIRAAVTADATASYALRAAVAADSAASYALRAAAQADQAAAYAIRAAVASDLAGGYAIQSAGTVTTGLDAAYAVRGSVVGDISVGYQIAAAVQAEVTAAYTVRAAVQKDLAAGYAIDAGVSSVAATLSAAYWIDGEAVILTPDAKFIARGAARNKTVTAAARRYQIATRST